MMFPFLFWWQRPVTTPFLRDARADDASALAHLHAHSFARGWDTQEFERLLCTPVVRGHVVSSGARGTVVGFVLSNLVAPEAEILSIAISGDVRRQGLGAQLLKHHLHRLAAEGVCTSFLEVEEGNTAALRLYTRMGYEQVGRRKGYYGAGADALLLRRDF